MKRKFVIAIGGASGAIYAKNLLAQLHLLSREHYHVDVVMSDNAVINWKLENGHFDPSEINFKVYQNNNFFAPFASGSSMYDAMTIVPCSMGLLSRIASGVSDDLITRAADVMLKERRRLIVVPRETPYNLIHLRNMASLTEAGGIVCPASPSFYANPVTVDDLVQTVVSRILDLMQIPHSGYRWQE